MDNTIIEAIAKKTLELLPSGWERCVLRATIDRGYYNIYFYVQLGCEYTQCYDLPKKYDVTMAEINAVFACIYKQCVQNQETDGWSAFTLTVSSSGKLALDFEYGEPLDKAEWKEKYLK